VKQAITLLLSVFTVVSTGVAQEESAQDLLRKGLASASAGDTVLALAEFRKALDLDPRLADAHYHIGRLYTQRASAVETDFGDRINAERALLQALELRPKDPRYLLELAKLRLKQHIHVDAARLFNRAREEAQSLGDPRILAEVHYNLGYIKELEYQSLHHKHMRPFFRGAPQARLDLMNDRVNRYANDYIDQSHEIEGSGELVREEMIEHYRAAVRADPSHVAAAVRLMGELLDEYHLSEYMSLARRLAEANPDQAIPYLYMGLGMHVAGREEEASQAFDEALARMSDADRAAIERLDQVMRRKDAVDYMALDEDEREEFNQRYWRLSDPLLLTSANEWRLEHLARVAYADLRFAAPETGQRGWETDRGIIYIRYGHPAEIASYNAGTTYDRMNPFATGRRSIIWSYGEEGPVFVFRQMPGYLGARFAGDYEFIAENYRYVQPARYENIPSMPELVPLPVQIARFRGETPDEVALEIHAALPLVELSKGLDLEKGEIETGMFLLNADGQEVIRRTQTETVTYAETAGLNEYHSWRIALPRTEQLVAAVEARDAVTWRAAASRDTITAVPYPEDSLTISDILVADLITPLVETPERREELEILPNAGLEYRSGDPVHIYYEVYGLQPNEEGVVSYDVSLQLHVKDLHRGGGFAALLGALADAWGFSIKGDDRLELQYSREVELGDRDRISEYLSLDPQEVPPGEYEIRLRIWDSIADRMASQDRSFTVIDDEED
jgi:GWxTD domain-containing protein